MSDQRAATLSRLPSQLREQLEAAKLASAAAQENPGTAEPVNGDAGDPSSSERQPPAPAPAAADDQGRQPDPAEARPAVDEGRPQDPAPAGMDAEARAKSYQSKWQALQGMWRSEVAKRETAEASLEPLKARIATLEAQLAEAQKAKPAQQSSVDPASVLASLSEEQREALTPETMDIIVKVAAAAASQAVEQRVKPVAERVEKVDRSISERDAQREVAAKDKFFAKLSTVAPYIPSLTQDAHWAEFYHSQYDNDSDFTNGEAIERLVESGKKAGSDEERMRIANSIKRITDRLYTRLNPSRPGGMEAAPSSQASAPHARKPERFKLSELTEAQHKFARREISPKQMEEVRAKYKQALEKGLVDQAA